MKFKLVCYLLFFFAFIISGASGQGPFFPATKTIAVDKTAGCTEFIEHLQTSRTTDEGAEFSIDNGVTSKTNAKFEGTLQYVNLPFPVSGLLSMSAPKLAGDTNALVVLDTGNYKADTNFEVAQSPAAPILIIIGDTEICLDERTTIIATECPGKVIWSNGYVGASINAPIGVYTATCAVNNFVSENSLSVTIGLNSECNARIISTVNVSLCPNQNVVLNATGCGGTISWSTGATDTSLTVSSEGEYIAQCSSGEIAIATVRTYTSPFTVDTNAIAGTEILNAVETTTTNTISGPSVYTKPNVFYEPRKSIRTIPGFQLTIGSVFEGKSAGCNN